MSSVATNTTSQEEEEVAVVDELGMDELLNEIDKSPEMEKTAEEPEAEDAFPDSILLREAAEQLDAAATATESRDSGHVPAAIPLNAASPSHGAQVRKSPKVYFVQSG